jgi:hypothetical protein
MKRIGRAEGRFSQVQQFILRCTILGKFCRFRENSAGWAAKFAAPP